MFIYESKTRAEEKKLKKTFINRSCRASDCSFHSWIFFREQQSRSGVYFFWQNTLSLSFVLQTLSDNESTWSETCVQEGQARRKREKREKKDESTVCCSPRRRRRSQVITTKKKEKLSWFRFAVDLNFLSPSETTLLGFSSRVTTKQILLSRPSIQKPRVVPSKLPRRIGAGYHRLWRGELIEIAEFLIFSMREKKKNSTNDGRRKNAKFLE